MASLALSVLMALAAQSPDAAPAAQPPAPAPAAAEPAPAPADPSAVAPAPNSADTASPPKDPADASAPGAAPAAESASKPKKKDKKPFDIRNHLSGPFVGGVGLMVMAVGGILGAVAVVLQFSPLPFPGGNTEKAGFTTSAVVGAVFCALVGLSLMVVGTALLGVSLIGAF